MKAETRWWRWLFLLLLAPGCAPTLTPPGMQAIDQRRFGKLCHLAADEYPRIWQSDDGGTVFVCGGDFINGDTITLLKPGVMAPTVVPYPKGWVTHTHWLDDHGTFHDLPKFALNPSDPNVQTSLNDQSGLFFQCSWKEPGHTVYVGRVGDVRGWLFTTEWNDRFEPWQVCGRGDTVYLLDHRDSVDRYPFIGTAPNCWKFQRGPDAGSPFRKTDEFRLNGTIQNGTIQAVDPFSSRLYCLRYGNEIVGCPPFIFDTQKHQVICWLPINQPYREFLFLNDDWLDAELPKLSS